MMNKNKRRSGVLQLEHLECEIKCDIQAKKFELVGVWWGRRLHALFVHWGKKKIQWRRHRDPHVRKDEETPTSDDASSADTKCRIRARRCGVEHQVHQISSYN